MARFFIILAFVAGSNPVFSHRNETVTDAIFTYIYNQQFQKADSMLQAQNGQMDAFYFDVLTIDLYWWKHILFPSEIDSRQINVIIKTMEQENTDTPDKKIKHLVWLSYQLRFELKRYNIIGAIRLRFEIKKLLEEIETSELNYSKNRIKLYHLYNSLFRYLNNILNPLFSEDIRNERKSALLEIEGYTREDDLIISTLSGYFLGKIYLNIEKEPEKGKACFKLLSERFPQNELFATLSDDSGTGS